MLPYMALIRRGHASRCPLRYSIAWLRRAAVPYTLGNTVLSACCIPHAFAATHVALPASFRCHMQTREETDLRSLQRAKMEREGYARVKSSKGGTERLEVKLDGRKHRRQSRQSARQASEQQD